MILTYSRSALLALRPVKAETAEADKPVLRTGVTDVEEEVVKGYLSRYIVL